MNIGSTSPYKQSDINSMETMRLNNNEQLQYRHTNQSEGLDVHPIPIMSNLKSPNDTHNRHDEDSLREFMPIFQDSGSSTIPSLISPSRQLLKNISNQKHKTKQDRKKWRAQKYHGEFLFYIEFEFQVLF